MYRELSSLSGFSAGCRVEVSLQSFYSRRWKSTAVCGTCQQETTISCIFFAFPAPAC